MKDAVRNETVTVFTGKGIRVMSYFVHIFRERDRSNARDDRRDSFQRDRSDRRDDRDSDRRGARTPPRDSRSEWKSERGMNNFDTTGLLAFMRILYVPGICTCTLVSALFIEHQFLWISLLKFNRSTISNVDGS